jgi:hypothetical protein
MNPTEQESTHVQEDRDLVIAGRDRTRRGGDAEPEKAVTLPDPWRYLDEAPSEDDGP